MEYIYVCLQGATLHLRENQIQVTKDDEIIKIIPVFSVKVIELFGNVNISVNLKQYCLINGVEVIFYSRSGKYTGRLSGRNSLPNIKRLNDQLNIKNDESFSTDIAKIMIKAKIQNQQTILRRYNKESKVPGIESACVQIKQLRNKLDVCCRVDQIRGYEGKAARIFFGALKELIGVDYNFDGRTKRSAKDPINAVLDLGYSLLYQEIVGKIISRGLHPGLGIMHSDNEKRHALACDLMEEWRPVVIDSLVISLFNGNELVNSDFIYEDNRFSLTKAGLKTFLAKLEKKMDQEQNYVSDLNKPLSFRAAISYQVKRFAEAISSQDVGVYSPIIIR